jgi:hypothetical protein
MASFSQFLVIKALDPYWIRIRIGIQPKMLDPDPDEMNADPQPCFFYLNFFSYYIQHCFICRPSDSIVPTDAGIEPRTVATGALAVRRSNH